MKQLFGCHASSLPPLSTENSEEPDSYTDFVEHELLLGRVKRRARNGVPGGIDVLAGPATRDQDGQLIA
jgi:hypothetical protein